MSSSSVVESGITERNAVKFPGSNSSLEWGKVVLFFCFFFNSKLGGSFFFFLEKSHRFFTLSLCSARKYWTV